jgi:hypothetical protein
MKYKIKNTPFTRDLKNMAILCTDKSVKNKYEQQMALLSENKRRDEEINKIKDDISDIKSLLIKMIERGQNG